MDALTREQVRQIDRAAIDELGIPGVILMENAGRNATDAIEQFLGGSVAGKRIAVVAGAGNNGGDGFVIARHMDMRGANMATFLIAQPDKITSDAAVNLAILRALRHDIRSLAPADVPKMGGVLAVFDLIVDAVGGTGIRGALRGEQAEVVMAINAAARPVVAVDIPTGLDCDSGQAAGPAVRAALTVTFVARKKGFDAPGADAYTGKVVVADIGIPAEKVRTMIRGREMA
jgi:NAD(P)H-hydrate epimerase